jgi:apolipoprotein D and lipocalin family protein
MNFSKFIFLIVLVLVVGVGCSSQSKNSSPPLLTVKKVEVDRYLGNWFSVARIPNRFEKDCLQSKAEYSLENDNSLKVINICPTKSGGVSRVDGRAWIVDSSNAKLEVGFFQILGWYPGFARGDYWILGLGPIDERGLYSYAVVGEPSRKYGWILARSTVLEENLLVEAFKIVRQQGYSTDAFELVK